MLELDLLAAVCDYRQTIAFELVTVPTMEILNLWKRRGSVNGELSFSCTKAHSVTTWSDLTGGLTPVPGSLHPRKVAQSQDQDWDQPLLYFRLFPKQNTSPNPLPLAHASFLWPWPCAEEQDEHCGLMQPRPLLQACPARAIPHSPPRAEAGAHQGRAERCQTTGWGEESVCTNAAAPR